MSDRQIGAVTILGGADLGKYPDGNAFVIEGSDQRLLVDCSLTVRQRVLAGQLGHVDQIVISHAHEDHLAALSAFDESIPVLVHEDDALGVRSFEGLLQVFGYDQTTQSEWAQQLRTDFHIADHRDNVSTFSDGHVFDLGGGCTATVVHLPGHTRGHCGLLVEPDGVFFVADVDLTGFGPFYGDAWASLESFEWSLKRCAEIDARWYLTFHHKGLIEGAAEFRSQLADFAAVIARRDEALLHFFAEPHSIEDLVAQRFVYRPHNEGAFIDAVERRMGDMHIARLLRQGRLSQLEPGHYCAA